MKADKHLDLLDVSRIKGFTEGRPMRKSFALNA